MGINYVFTAIPAGQLARVLSPTDDDPSGWAEQSYARNNGDLSFDKPFGLLVEMLWEETRLGWADLSLALCGSKERDHGDGRGYLDAAEVKTAARALARVPKDKLERAVWGELWASYFSSSSLDREEEAEAVYHELMEALALLATLYAKAAQAGDVVLIQVG